MTNRGHYRISNKAIGDLENIWSYTRENWSLEQADRYYNLIIDEIEFIANNPEAGRYLEQLRSGYWVTKIKSHLIFYKITAEGPIEVIRILHQRMDLRSRLEES